MLAEVPLMILDRVQRERAQQLRLQQQQENNHEYDGAGVNGRSGMTGASEAEMLQRQREQFAYRLMNEFHSVHFVITNSLGRVTSCTVRIVGCFE